MDGGVSKRVRNQVKNGRHVASAAKTHRTAVADELVERQHASQGAELTAAEFERWLAWLEAEQRAVNQRLWRAELTYTAEQGDDAAVIEERDRLGDELEGSLRSARNNAIEIAGRANVSSYGLSNPPPSDMAGLADYAANCIELLRENSAPVTRAGMTFDPSAVADHLEKLADDYQAALEEDKMEKRELEQARGVRDRAMADWKITYQGVAGQLEGLFRQAGRDDLAERVRPTSNRARGEEEPPEDVDLGDLEDDSDSPEPEPVEPAVDEA